MKQLLKRALDTAFRRRCRLRRSDSVLLTFDDGPHAEVTPRVLERLRTYGARAIFFVVGNRISNAPEMLARIVAEGHLLGNHTYSHWQESEPGLREYYRDVRHCQQELADRIGSAPKVFRAPHGRTSLCSMLVPVMLGLQNVQWSLDENDWQLRSAAAAVSCAERMAAKVAKGDIVLFHDDNPWVVDVLDSLLPQLKARGFDLASGIDAL